MEETVNNITIKFKLNFINRLKMAIKIILSYKFITITLIKPTVYTTSTSDASDIDTFKKINDEEAIYLNLKGI